MRRDAVHWKALEDDISNHLRRIDPAYQSVNRTHIFNKYNRNLQSFVRQVGCAKVHDKPEDNIAELRLFHSTSIGYFAKLQDQYIKQQLEIKELRHYISALEFRQVLEHLPDVKLHKDASPRWMKFWHQALEDEADHHWNKTTRSPDHALRGIVEDRNPKRGTWNSNTNTGKWNSIHPIYSVPLLPSIRTYYFIPLRLDSY